MCSKTHEYVHRIVCMSFACMSFKRVCEGCVCVSINMYLSHGFPNDGNVWMKKYIYV